MTLNIVDAPKAPTLRDSISGTVQFFAETGDPVIFDTDRGALQLWWHNQHPQPVITSLASANRDILFTSGSIAEITDWLLQQGVCR